MLSWRVALLWGFISTLTMTALMAGTQGMGLTRMNIPYVLGSIFTPNRDRATLIGFGVQVVNGWIFSLVYAAAVESWRRATWWLGAVAGLVQAVFVVLVGTSIIPPVGAL